jgi:hypothetical protein
MRAHIVELRDNAHTRSVVGKIIQELLKSSDKTITYDRFQDLVVEVEPVATKEVITMLRNSEVFLIQDNKTVTFQYVGMWSFVEGNYV